MNRQVVGFAVAAGAAGVSNLLAESVWLRVASGVLIAASSAALATSVAMTLTTGERYCRGCGHTREAHMHYRPGTDCSAVLRPSEDELDVCPCPRYRQRWI